MAILCSGRAISLAELRRNVILLEDLTPVFTLIVRISPDANCATVNAVRQVLDGSINCRIGRCVLGEQWDAWMGRSGTS